MAGALKEIDLDQAQKLRSEGKTLAEVARAVGCSVPTLGRRLHSSDTNSAHRKNGTSPHSPRSGFARAPRLPRGPFKLALAELDRQEKLIAEARAALEALATNAS